MSEATRTGGRGARRVIVVLAFAALLASGCVEKVEESSTAGTAIGSTPPAAGSTTGTVVDEYAGERMSFGVIPSSAQEATGEPITIGMINQENTPLGSFPELRLGVEAAVEFINEELNGVGGRPIELVTCITAFSVEKSQACAQEMVQRDAVAVIGGIDITSNGSIPILEANQIPYIGGIPVNFDEMRSPISFQFSGGAPGAMVAFADYAAEVQGAKKVAIAYGEFESIEAAAIDFGAKTLRQLGVTDVVQVPFPITTTDFLPVLTKANEGNPDAIFLGAADTACAPAMKTAEDLGITAKLYLVGACAAPGLADQVGEAAVNGRIFNVEGPVSQNDREAQLYFAVLGRYADPALQGAERGNGQLPRRHELVRPPPRSRPRRRVAVGVTRSRSFRTPPSELRRSRLHVRRATGPGPAVAVLATADPRRTQWRDARSTHRLDRRTRHPAGPAGMTRSR